MTEENTGTNPVIEDKEMVEASEPPVTENNPAGAQTNEKIDEKPTEVQTIENKDSNKTDNIEEMKESVPMSANQENVEITDVVEDDLKETVETTPPDKVEETLPEEKAAAIKTQKPEEKVALIKTQKPEEEAPKLPPKQQIESENTQNYKVVVISDSNFWLDGNYRKVVRRIEDGSKILDDLARMIHERAEIESMYANKLKAWQRKWIESCSKSFEYGTAQQSMLNSLREGGSIADLHLSVYGRLEELSRSIQQWRNDTYPKAMGMKIKEAKRSEEAFGKAQKPWITKYNEVNKCMKAYHSAHHLFDTNKKQLLEAESSIATTSEQLNKLQVKGKKFEQDIVLMKEKYADAIRDISNYNTKYQEDMKYEFEKCQRFESTRRDFLKEKLKLFHSFITRNIFIENYKSIYAEMEHLYDCINTNTDLEWYIENYGPSHPFVTLSFVEYDENIHQQLNEATSRPQGANQSTKPKKSGVCTTL